MRVLHVEVPRGLTLAVRPWRADLHQQLAAAGHESHQVDLNGAFWRWCLDDERTDTFGRLLDIAFQPAAFDRALIERASDLAQMRTPPDGAFDLRGLSLDDGIANDTRRLHKWVEQPNVLRWFAAFFERVDRLCERWDVVTLGVGANEELAFAAALARFVQAVSPQTHVALAYHQWENFTLAPAMQRIASDGALIDLFDAAFLQRETAPAAATALCAVLGGAPIETLTNVVTRVDGVVRTFGPPETRAEPTGEADLDEALASYLDETTIPRHRIYQLESIVRNDCYFGACTFCNQNSGYARRQYYKVEPELDRTLALVERLSRFGVRNFGFVDQAIAPKVLRDFSDRLARRELDVRWCGRMLFDTALDDDLFEAAAKSGCKEILFGIETLSTTVLAEIGKGPTRATADGLHDLVDTMGRHGIDATLNFIWGLPSQADADFADTTAPAIAALHERHDNVAVILNSFELFDETPMAKTPEAHGLTSVEPRDGDLGFLLEYEDRHGRVGPRPLPAELTTDAIHDDLSFVGYASFGLLYRWDCGRGLLPAVRAATENADAFDGRDQLVLGANGYLGYNLARHLPAERLVLSSRAITPAARFDAPYVTQDLTKDSVHLRRLAPKHVWLAARPVTDHFDEEATFLATLQSVLHAWAAAGALERLTLFSTQLVCATPGDGVLVDGRTETAPEQPYELMKTQLEIFAAYLARSFDVAVDVVRLPLLAGGHMLPGHEDEQLLMQWRRELNDGARWRFDDDDSRRFGNSWVDVDDLIAALRAEAPPSGYRVRTAKSGDFTYAELQDHWPDVAPTAEMPLVRSKFFVADELGLPKRTLDIT